MKNLTLQNDQLIELNPNPWCIWPEKPMESFILCESIFCSTCELVLITALCGTVEALGAEFVPDTSKFLSENALQI